MFHLKWQEEENNTWNGEQCHFLDPHKALVTQLCDKNE